MYFVFVSDFVATLDFAVSTVVVVTCQALDFCLISVCILISQICEFYASLFLLCLFLLILNLIYHRDHAITCFHFLSNWSRNCFTCIQLNVSYFVCLARCMCCAVDMGLVLCIILSGKVLLHFVGCRIIVPLYCRALFILPSFLSIGCSVFCGNLQVKIK